MIRYIRWLSLEICISWELKKFTGLKSYFLSENARDARFRQLKSAYEDPMTEVYLLFFQALLPCFTNFNKLLQQEEPLIYQLHDAQQRFLHKLASKFVKPTVIQEHKTAGLSFANLDISLESQRDNAELGIRITTITAVMRLLKKQDVEAQESG